MSLEGICEECGNTGIAGEICSFCGNKIASLDANLDQYEEDNDVVVPRAKKQSRTDDFDVEPDLDELADFDAEEDLEELDSLDEEEGADTASLEELAEDEEREENEEADLKHINIDEDNDEDTA